MLLLALLLLLLLGLVVAAVALAGAGRLVGRAACGRAGEGWPGRWRRLGPVLAASSLVGLAVWMSGSVRDPVVVIDGEPTSCSVGIGDDDLPNRVVEQCDAQDHDRSMQARVAALTATAASAITLWAASGRSSQGRRERPSGHDIGHEVARPLSPER